MAFGPGVTVEHASLERASKIPRKVKNLFAPAITGDLSSKSSIPQAVTAQVPPITVSSAESVSMSRGNAANNNDSKNNALIYVAIVIALISLLMNLRK